MPKTNGEYWKQRSLILEQSKHKKAMDYYSELDKQYKIADKRIQEKINTWYSRFAQNNNISMFEAKRLLNTKELAEFKWDVDDYIKYGRENAIDGRWIKQLENASSKVHISRLEALRVQLQNQVEILYGNQLDGIDKLAKDIFSDSYYHTAYEIQKGLNVGWDLNTLDEKRLSTVINKPWTTDNLTFSDRIWTNKNKLIGTIQTELTQSIMRGESVNKIIGRVSDKMGVGKKQAARLVLTESAYFHSEAQGQCFKDLDVELYEIVATLDKRTSEICQDLDGKIYSMKDYSPGETASPFHPYCRTVQAPFFDDEEGFRAARNEEGKTYLIPSDIKYKDWKKSFVDGGSKEGLEILNASNIILKRDTESEIFNKLGSEHYDNIQKIVNNAPIEEKTLWAKVESQLKVKSATANVHPRCHGTHGIEMNVNKDALGSKTKNPYQTTFHEFGHNIDYIANVKCGNGLFYKPYSATYKDGLFGETLKQDVAERISEYEKIIKSDLIKFKNNPEALFERGYISKYNLDNFKQTGKLFKDLKYSKSMAYSKLQTEIRKIPVEEAMNLHDIMEGATNSKVVGLFGHGKSYWKNESHLPTEAFAEMFDSTISGNIKQLEAIKKYFPKSYDIYLEIIKNISEAI